MSNNKLYYQTRSCKMQEAKNNPQYLVELPSCAWARRRRIWNERKCEIRDPDTSARLLQTTYIKSLRQRYKQTKKSKLSIIWKYNFFPISLSALILCSLVISSHCLYYEKKENAHTKKQHPILNHLSPLEGKF